MGDKESLVPLEQIERSILLIRGEKVMLDADLAALYGVATKVLVQAIKRHQERFPADFMFQLSRVESDQLAGLDRKSPLAIVLLSIKY